MVELSRRQVLTGGAAVAATGLLTWSWAGALGPPAAVPVPTSFGSVSLLGARVSGRTGVHGHDAATAAGASAAAAVAAATLAAHRTWPGLLRVDVAIANHLERAVAFSPGQFRLRVGADGPTVTALDTELTPGALPAGRTVRTWLTFLVPAAPAELSLSFEDTAATLALAVHTVEDR
ncbi:twin-arginine translocation signal domain-containing protein [Georgenia muralis]